MDPVTWATSSRLPSDRPPSLAWVASSWARRTLCPHSGWAGRMQLRLVRESQGLPDEAPRSATGCKPCMGKPARERPTGLCWGWMLSRAGCVRGGSGQDSRVSARGVRAARRRRGSSAKASLRLILWTKGPPCSRPQTRKLPSTCTPENPAKFKPHPTQHLLSLQPHRSWGRGSHKSLGNASQVKLSADLPSCLTLTDASLSASNNWSHFSSTRMQRTCY